MTSITKPTVTLDLSAIVDGTVADAADVTTPFNQIPTYITNAQQYVGVSSADTHIKHLYDAITVSGGITKAIATPGGNETILLDVSTASLGALVKIVDRTEFGSNQSAFTMSSIPNTYNHLLLVANLRSSAGGAGVSDDLIIRLNGDSGSNYTNLSTETKHSASLATTEDLAAGGLTGWRVRNAINNSSGAAVFTGVRIWLFDIQSNDSVHMLCEAFRYNGETANGNALIEAGGRYNNGSTNIITSILMKPSASNTFLAGSSYALYGLK